MSARIVGQNRGRVACGAAAGAAAAAIQPVHVLAVVVPDAKGQDHARGQSLAHGCEAAIVRGRRARGDDVAAGLGAWDGNAVLDVLAGDADKVAGRAAGIRVKLGSDGEGLGGINSQSGAVVAIRSVRRQFINYQSYQHHRHGVTLLTCGILRHRG